MTRKRHRSAVSGRFVDAAEVSANPRETVSESVSNVVTLTEEECALVLAMLRAWHPVGDRPESIASLIRRLEAAAE